MEMSGPIAWSHTRLDVQIDFFARFTLSQSVTKASIRAMRCVISVEIRYDQAKAGLMLALIGVI